MRVIVIVHIFYNSLVNELSTCLLNISEHNDATIYFTYNSLTNNTKIFLRNKFPNAIFCKVNNKGYDIWPFFYVLNQVTLKSFDLIIKLHTKRDMPEYTRLKIFSCPGTTWREHLLAFCNTRENWHKTQKKFISNQKVGMVSDSLVIFNYKWDPSKCLYKQIIEIMDKLNLKYKKNNNLFVAGSMFAVRAELFKCLQNKFIENDFEYSSCKHIEGLPHVLERVLGFCVYSQGYCLESFNNKNFKLEIFKRTCRKILFYKQTTKRHVLYKILGIPIYIKNNYIHHGEQ